MPSPTIDAAKASEGWRLHRSCAPPTASCCSAAYLLDPVSLASEGLTNPPLGPQRGVATPRPHHGVREGHDPGLSCWSESRHYGNLLCGDPVRAAADP